MFFVIGELINSSRGMIKQALKDKNEELIRNLANTQMQAEADAIDLNAAEAEKREKEDLGWLIEIVEDEVEDVRICIDTPNCKVLEFALEKVTNRPIINSISNEAGMRKSRELAADCEAEVIGLAMGENGMPSTLEDRLKETESLLRKCDKSGIDRDRLYLDVVGMTIGSNQRQGQVAIDSVREIRDRFGIKTTIGLSNVSFGLPDRSLLNRTFFAMLLEAGLDAALLDPTDNAVLDTLKASQALLGVDKNCLNYLQYKRRS